ncbi:MAG: hypothetical protein ACOC8I_03525 [Desulfosalsimonas sp.]
MPASKAKAALRMNGLRVSGLLIRFDQEFESRADSRLEPLYRKLAADRVNISFLFADGLGPAKRICCLVDRETAVRSGDDPAGVPGVTAYPEEAAAAMVSVFPHRFDPSAVGATIRAFGKEDVPWHYMATSGSMVTFVIDYKRRGKAVSAIEKHIDLPESHGPLCPGLDHDPIARSLKIAPETVARYVEKKIRTYGINVRTGLSLCSMHMTADEFEQWSRSAGEKNFRFCYASAFNVPGEKGPGVKIILDTAGTEGEATDSGVPALRELMNSVSFRKNAEMISFHGPHFGDRHGIADKALGTLKNAGVSVWLAGCAGATVTMVIPPDTSNKAVKALSEAFEIP